MKRIIIYMVVILQLLLFIWIYFMEFRYVVISNSMYPTLISGDVVSIQNIDNTDILKCGDVVAFKRVDEDTLSLFVKRIENIDTLFTGEIVYFMCGDNMLYSYDSRYFGWIPKHNIIGRVSYIMWSQNEKSKK